MKQRKYTDKVKDLLSQYHEFKALQDVGDYKATDILIDLHIAIKRAGLTQKQREVFDMVIVKDMSQKTVAKLLNISEMSVSNRMAYVVVKIAAVLESWDYLDEYEGALV